MSEFLLHIWKNYKTTLASLVSVIVVYLLWRGLILQDTAELVTQILLLVGASANVIMKKR